MLGFETTLFSTGEGSTGAEITGDSTFGCTGGLVGMAFSRVDKNEATSAGPGSKRTNIGFDTKWSTELTFTLTR